MSKDPRAPRTAKDFPNSPQPGYKANGWNEARAALLPQLEAADRLSACLDAWVERYVATDAVSFEDLKSTVHCCRTFRRLRTAHETEQQ